MIKKCLLLFFLISFVLSNANANIFKIDGLEIKLFDNNKLIKSSRIMTDGFGKVQFKAFAEKIDDQNFGSIILVVYSKIDKFGPFVRNFFLEYFFKNDNAIFQKEDANQFFVDEGMRSAMQVKEIDLEKFIKRSDDFFEVRSALKGLYKKSSLKNNDRVIKSDHVYLKSNGNLVWVSYMFNYETAFKEELLLSGKSKFHPTNINNFPHFKSYMDNWSNLAFKRHTEFQKKLKIKSKVDLVSYGFNDNQDLDYYENIFFSSNINNKLINTTKAKEEKEQKAKKEQERKAKEEKEQKAKEEQERKAKEEQERKAKLAAEKKANEEKERKAKEQKSKIEKSKAEDEISVDDLMSKIKELNEMFKSGLISKEEFEMLKKKLLKN